MELILLSNTVWSFGDSFAQVKDYRTHWTNTDVEEHWIKQIANKKAYTNRAYGCAGSSLSYTYAKLNDIRFQIKENDIIIICLTNAFRKWFWYNRPHLASHYADKNMNPNFVRQTTIEERSALRQYIMHLDNNPMLEFVYLRNFLDTLSMLTEQKKLTTIIIPTSPNEGKYVRDISVELPNLTITKGDLIDVSYNEIALKTNKDDVLKNDCRQGHIIKSNHTILANKILTYLWDKSTIDLTEGFVTNIIDKKFMKDPNLHLDELFGVRWTVE